MYKFIVTIQIVFGLSIGVGAVEISKVKPISGDGYCLGISAPFSAAIGQYVYVAGGCNFPDTPVAEGGSKVYYNDIWCLNTEGTMQNWIKIGKLPIPAAYGLSIAYQDKVLLIGGNTANGALASVWSMHWQPTKATLVADTLPDLPFGMYNMSGALHGDILYVVGGMVDNIASNILLSLELSKPQNGWQILPSFPGSPRIQLQAGILGKQKAERLYIWGGFTFASHHHPAAILCDGYYYDLQTATWHFAGMVQVDRLHSPISLGGATSIVLDNHQMLFVGGVHHEKMMKEMQIVARRLLPGYADNHAWHQEDATALKTYLSQPPAYYAFNDRLLLFDLDQNRWITLDQNPCYALAGATILQSQKAFYLLNGEVKPGVRTPLCWRITLTESELSKKNF